MLGFILSKMNLLILVLAVFSILSYFLFGLNQILIEKNSLEFIREQKETIYSMVASSQSLCDKKTFYLRPSIQTSPGNSFNRGFYYKLIIKKQEKEGMTKIIFQLTPRTNEKQVIAADSFDVNAKVHFFDYKNLSDASIDGINLDENTLTVLDPQAFPPINSYVFVVQVEKGEKHIFFIPCNVEAGIGDAFCREFYTKVKRKMMLEDVVLDCPYEAGEE